MSMFDAFSARAKMPMCWTVAQIESKLDVLLVHWYIRLPAKLVFAVASAFALDDAWRKRFARHPLLDRIMFMVDDTGPMIFDYADQYRRRCAHCQAVEQDWSLIRDVLADSKSSAHPQFPVARTLYQHACEQKRTGGGTFSVCGNCRVACYCSRDCQVAHWKAAHKQQGCTSDSAAAAKAFGPKVDVTQSSDAKASNIVARVYHAGEWRTFDISENGAHLKGWGTLAFPRKTGSPVVTAPSARHRRRRRPALRGLSYRRAHVGLSSAAC
jgi:hypothetical protein